MTYQQLFSDLEFLLLPDNYYILNVNLTNNISSFIGKKYRSLSTNTKSIFDYNSSNYKKLYDAGIDLFVPNNTLITKNTFSNTINLEINCSMLFVSKNKITNEETILPCAYYLYPRSSTGSKTPLRLSNSVGIMDSGYRGNVIACFDNTSNEDYEIKRADRLVQICPPNITYPTIVNIVNDINQLDFNVTLNTRGNNGFGSSGR